MQMKAKGFTLIELMIVVIIIGVMAAIAIPGYQSHVRKGHRANAQGHLMNIAQRQQQYFTDAREYASSLATLGMTTPSKVSSYYTITITLVAGPPPEFTITATPITGSIQEPDGALTIDNTGAKTPSGKW